MRAFDKDANTLYAEAMKKILNYIRNYWYYYKVYVITGVLVIAALIYSFTHSGDGPKHDHNAALIFSQSYTKEQVDGLRAALVTEYGSCGLNLYRIELGALNQEESTVALLGMDLAEGTSDILLIEDMDAFYEVTSGIDISEPVRVKDVPYLAGLGFDDLWYVTRK